jgi:hypothetical protein
MTIGQMNILMREHGKDQRQSPQQLPRRAATLEDAMRMPGFEVEVNRLGDD